MSFLRFLRKPFGQESRYPSPTVPASFKTPPNPVVHPPKIAPEQRIENRIESKIRTSAPTSEATISSVTHTEKSTTPKRLPFRPVVGLDFGTCFSKIVVRDQGRRIVEVVRDGAGKCLFPSMIGLEKDMLFGPYAVTPKNAVPYLKIHALELDGQDEFDLQVSEEMNAIRARPDWQEVLHAMLAWYFVHLVARTRFHLQSAASQFKDFDDCVAGSRDQIAFNLCIPVLNPEMSSAAATMLSALRCADLIYKVFPDTMDTKIPLQEWMDKCRELKISQAFNDRKDLIFGYPEVAAGVQSVLQSQSQPNGIYITADVGGGTLDLNVFCMNTGQDIFNSSQWHNDQNYYASLVVPWGSERIAGRTHPYKSHHELNALAAIDWGLNTQSEPIVESKVQREVNVLMTMAKLKQPNIRTSVSSVYDKARVFLWGGGAAHPCYRRAIVNALMPDLSHEAAILNLPVPDDLLSGVKPDEAGRLAVAYGLSFSRDNLGNVRPPDKIPDVHRQRRPRRPDSPYTSDHYW